MKLIEVTIGPQNLGKKVDISEVSADLLFHVSFEQ